MSGPQLSRRAFVQAVAAGTGGLVGLGPVTAAFGAASQAPVLVHVFLRGGMDGLSAVVPAGDSDYHSARPTIAVPPAEVIALDGRFGLHPALEPLAEPYRRGDLGFVVGAGILGRSRSHFEVTDMCLAGASREDDRVRDGWLARYLAGLGEAGGLGPETTFAGTAMGAPSAFAGWPAMTMGSLRSLDLTGVRNSEVRVAVTKSLDALYRDSSVGASGPSQAVGSAGQRAVAAIEQIRGIDSEVSEAYPNTSTGRAFAEAAQLIRADVGLAALTIDLGGWDTHRDMGTTAAGRMSNLLANLGGALGAMADDLGSELSRVTVVVQSEFGRRVAENGSRGTDHGHGGVMMVLGRGLGGRVYGDWVGLGADELDRGDVPTLTDYRNVLADVVARRTPVSAERVFAGTDRVTVLG